MIAAQSASYCDSGKLILGWGGSEGVPKSRTGRAPSHSPDRAWNDSKIGARGAVDYDTA